MLVRWVCGDHRLARNDRVPKHVGADPKYPNSTKNGQYCAAAYDIATATARLPADDYEKVHLEILEQRNPNIYSTLGGKLVTSWA